MPIDFPTSPANNETYTSGDTQWIWNGTVWNVVSSSGAGGGSGEINQNAFSNVAVSGQPTIQADAKTDTLTLVAGSNVTITTDDSTDSVTIAASVTGGEGSSNSFSTIAVSGQNNVVADSSTDTLTLVAGSNITITTNDSADSITVAASSGATTLTQLTDVLSTGITVDEIYLPAITKLVVTNNGASAYRFDQYGTSDNPTIYVINGTTIAFKLSASGHPFLIQNSTGDNYNTGLIHVSVSGVVSTGASAQGKDSGTLYWKVPSNISSPPSYRYQCGSHVAMVGQITIKNFGSI